MYKLACIYLYMSECLCVRVTACVYMQPYIHKYNVFICTYMYTHSHTRTHVLYAFTLSCINIIYFVYIYFISYRLIG